jgi:hypothetical protein
MKLELNFFHRILRLLHSFYFHISQSPILSQLMLLMLYLLLSKLLLFLLFQYNSCITHAYNMWYDME